MQVKTVHLLPVRKDLFGFRINYLGDKMVSLDMEAGLALQSMATPGPTISLSP